MIKKRFTHIETELLFYILDDGKILSEEEVLDLLNEQHERIQQLEDKNYELKQTVAQLVKESKETSQKKEKYNIQPYIIMKKGDVE